MVQVARGARVVRGPDVLHPSLFSLGRPNWRLTNSHRRVVVVLRKLENYDAFRLDWLLNSSGKILKAIEERMSEKSKQAIDKWWGYKAVGL